MAAVVIIRRTAKFANGFRAKLHRDTRFHIICRSLPALSRYLTVVAVVSRNVARGLRNILRYGRNRDSNKDILWSKVRAIFIITDKSREVLWLYVFRD